LPAGIIPVAYAPGQRLRDSLHFLVLLHVLHLGVVAQLRGSFDRDLHRKTLQGMLVDVLEFKIAYFLFLLFGYFVRIGTVI
jgi:hypothetical protein